MLLGQQIRAARALLGWSQAQLAKKAEVSDMTIKRFESQQQELFGTVQSSVRIQQALEAGGVVFIDQDDKLGPGVRLANRV
jgi:transcriptional regulator with XRE-family HTH domain